MSSPSLSQEWLLDSKYFTTGKLSFWPKKFGGDATMIGDEGSLFATPCDVDSELAMLIRATEKAGYLPR